MPSFQLQDPLFTPGIVYISKKAKHPQHAWPLIFAKIFVGIIAVVGLIYGWLLYKNHLRMPLGIERDLTVLFFFSCGWLSKGLIKRPNHNAKALAAIATVSFIIYAIAEIPDPNFSIMNNDLGKSLPKFIISSIFGIIGLTATFILADKLSDIFPIRFIKGILRNISRNALVILAVHWYILLVLRLLFRSEINKPGIAYLSIAVVAAGVIAAIPLFRCKLYKLLGKQPASVREALNIKE